MDATHLEKIRVQRVHRSELLVEETGVLAKGPNSSDAGDGRTLQLHHTLRHHQMPTVTYHSKSMYSIWLRNEWVKNSTYHARSDFDCLAYLFVDY